MSVSRGLPPARSMLAIIGAIGALALWAAVVELGAGYDDTGLGPGQDARCYWIASLTDPYAHPLQWTKNAYIYSPAFLQVLAPLRALPWPLFLGAWTAMLIGVAAWLGGRRWLVAPALVIAFVEVWGGNIHLLLAAAVVLGFRWPAAWSFVLLTKVTPGIGLLWFAVRREWRSLGLAVGATLAIAGVSLLLAPDLWVQWLAALDLNARTVSTADWVLPLPLAVRLPMAAALVIYGARTDRAWTVPVAAMLALPVLRGGGFSMLLAVVPLVLAQRPGRPTAPAYRVVAPDPRP
jgi:glycosyl transferase family 87